MKTKLHKTYLFLLLIMFAMQVQGQAWGGTLGVYKIKVKNENLYLTQSATTDNVTYEQEVTGSDAQLFVFNNHPDGDYFSITSKLPGKGALEVLTITGTTNPAVGCKGNVAGNSGQQDKWNPTRGTGTQIFLESPDSGTGWEGSSKRRFQDYALGSLAKLNGGTAVVFDFVLVSTLSTEEFDTSSFFMSNLVNEELVMKGIPSNVKKVAIFSLLGQEMLSREVESETLKVDVVALKSGMYIVELSGESGKFTKKIIKK